VNPITHALVGWSVAQGTTLGRRDRALVTVAGVAPDVDGLGILVDWATRLAASPTEWWGHYHHVLGHNLAFGLVVATAAFFLGARRKLVFLLALLSFHLHLLGDLVGARGPDGDQWPIPYLAPFSSSWQLSWQGQWALNAWPNVAITVALLGVALYLAWWRGFSPVELVSARADREFVRTLRSRFGGPRADLV
jgi:hypothetical protein